MNCVVVLLSNKNYLFVYGKVEKLGRKINMTKKNHKKNQWTPSRRILKDKKGTNTLCEVNNSFYLFVFNFLIFYGGPKRPKSKINK